MKPDLNNNSCDSVRPRQVRKIGPTRQSVSGRFVFRGETAIPYESTLERDFLIRCAFSLSVLDVIPQPVSIPYLAENGQTYPYTPDFLVYHKLGDRDYCHYPKPELVEVKPTSEWQANWRQWSTKWKEARRYAREQGWIFRIYDESRIRDTFLKNIRFLDRYKRMSFPEEESLAVVATVHEMGSATMDYLLARHFAGLYRAGGISHIWHLVAMRRLDCEMHSPLSDVTELWVPTDV